MKKSLLTILIASALLSACNEKETALSQKIQENEQTITQLKTDLDAAQSELSRLRTETEKSKNTFPTLNTMPEVLFDKTETVKPQQNTTEEQQEEAIAAEEANLTFNVSTITTGVQWLDNLLLDSLINNVLPDDSKASNGQDRKAVLLTLLENHYQSDQKLLKEGGAIAVEYSVNIDYLGQRNNIAAFVLFQYSYSGGAHGMHYSKHINVDTNSRKVLTLDNIVPKEQQAALKTLLWKAYLESLQKGEKPFVAEKDFTVSAEFYFDINGLNFVYPPYAIGPYSEGEITLMLSWNEANQILNNEFQR